MSKNTFMIFDLIILTTIGVILEVLGIVVQVKFVSSPTNFWFVSLTTVIILIAMFRWGFFGFFSYFFLTLATVITYSIVGSISLIQYFIYLLGTAFVGINLLWFKIIRKDKMAKRLGYIVLYSLSGYILIALGRSLIALFGGFSFNDTLRTFIFGEAFTIVIGIIIMIIVYHQKTILVDIDKYLQEINEKGENP